MTYSRFLYLSLLYLSYHISYITFISHFFIFYLGGSVHQVWTNTFFYRITCYIRVSNLGKWPTFRTPESHALGSALHHYLSPYALKLAMGNLTAVQIPENEPWSSVIIVTQWNQRLSFWHPVSSFAQSLNLGCTWSHTPHRMPRERLAAPLEHKCNHESP